MAELPHHWAMYARLQENLLRNHRVDARSWAIESGMDHILETVSDATPTQIELDRVIATSARRERHRCSRREPMLDDIASTHPEDALMARSDLMAVRRRVGEHNWELLTAVGMGTAYDEIAAAASRPASTVRVKVQRLRASLAAAA